MPTSSISPRIAFIGGGNMASAILGGLLRQGLPADHITVVEPFAPTRAQLEQQWAITAWPDALAAASALAQADVVVWAVKPQMFRDAAAPVAAHTRQALHLSVAAGIPSASIARWLDNVRVVRAMPNTPALIGQGMSGLFACPQVDSAGRTLVERIMAGTGQFLWVQEETQLDAVTALSGSGPAYVFLLLEAMTEAGTAMGLTPEQSYQLAVATFQGASALAAQSPEDAATLRQRVTSKGGTTHAAITHMQAMQVPEHFKAALERARVRAQELAAEFGA